MTDTVTCSECGMKAESKDDVEIEHDIDEIEIDDDNGFNLFAKRDLFLCKECRNPLGVSRS